MKRLLSLFAVIVLLASCKSNQEAYRNTYQKLKEKENTDIQVEAKAQTAMSVKSDTTSLDSAQSVRSETYTVLLGERNANLYSLVARTFVNRTNAKAYYSRLEEEGLPAVLIQNADLMYRVFVASFPDLESALARKEELGESYPGMFVLMRK